MIKDFINKTLDQLKSVDRYRDLTSRPSSADLIDLTTNDYLGYLNDQQHQQTLHQACVGVPAGAGGSRLLGGEHPEFQLLEQEFCQFKQAPASLFFPSGYAANEGVISCLSGAHFFSDELNHASIIDGIRLAKPRGKDIFRHRNLDHLESALKKSAGPRVIVSETLFSMDGDRADVVGLWNLAKKYDALLILDEAHAIGVWGPQGRGLAHQIPIDDVVTINTCGKALAVQGCLVTCSESFRQFLINRARSFIYTTAPSPWTAVALRHTIKSLPEQGDRRFHLQSMAAKLKTGLEEIGLATMGDSQIIPIIIGADGESLQRAEHMLRHRVLAKAIRPPTVAPGTSRIRLSLTANVADIEPILESLK